MQMSFARCPSCQRTEPFPSYILAKSSIHCAAGGENLFAVDLQQLDEHGRVDKSPVTAMEDCYSRRRLLPPPVRPTTIHKIAKAAPENIPARLPA